MGPRRRSRRVTPVLVFLVTLVSSGLATSVDADSTGIKLRLVRKVGEGISPKSVVASSGGSGHCAEHDVHPRCDGL